MKKKNKKNDPEPQSFWQSYSDMMAALLLVFVLIIAFAITLTKATYEEKEAELEKQNARISEYEEQLQEQQEALENQQKRLENQQEQLDAIIGIRANVIQKLKETFEENEMAIAIDPSTGAISLDANILFDKDSTTLKPEGIAFLNSFFPYYFQVMLGDGVKEYISEVIIEGHTDSEGSYLYNLDLSQKRAYAVLEYCLNDNTGMFVGETLEEVRSIVTANGKAYYDLVYDEYWNENQDASRRVEIKFRLREDEMISEMSELLG